jgi:hypothetical protein
MVHVVFLDARNGKTIGESDVPADQLPESFEIATKLGIGGQQWSVFRAEPTTRADYTRTGTLRLELRPILTLDPKTILFSLPTIESTQPPLPGRPGPGALTLHEDDWRQIEVVARRFEPEIAADQADIRAVKSEFTGSGFVRIHIRERIPEPLAGVTLPLASLFAGFTLGELAIAGQLVEGGFAYGDNIYGRQVDGNVVALCAAKDPAALAEIAAKHALVVVAWCRS